MVIEGDGNYQFMNMIRLLHNVLNVMMVSPVDKNIMDSEITA